MAWSWMGGVEMTERGAHRHEECSRRAELWILVAVLVGFAAGLIFAAIVG